MPQPPGSGRPQQGNIGFASRSESLATALGSERSFGAEITAVLPVGEGFAIATGDGQVLFSTPALETARAIAAHSGAILSAAAIPDGQGTGGLVTGGDDGRVVHTTPGSETVELWRSPQHRWVDHVAARSDGAVAWTSGKTAYVSMAGTLRELVLPSAAGGLSFAPKTNRLAIGHYGGVTVWSLDPDDDTTQLFEWKGSHLETYWSPDERYIATAMQEGAIHGWRLADGNDFAMRGYPGKPRSLSFSRKGDWMATSGAFEAVLWPFAGKGPMGKTPEQLARRTYLVTAVAYHPLNAYVATGYQDGVVLLARQDDRRELMVRRTGKGPVTAVVWSRSGKQLAYGTQDGQAGIVDFTALSNPPA